MKPQRLSGTLSEGLCIYTKIMKLIPLTQGKFAMVDDADYEWLNQWRWYAVCFVSGGWYVRHNNMSKTKTQTETMHALIMCNNPEGLYIDHKDGNGLNNQRSNLRFATMAENNRNRKLQKNNMCGYKGVQVRESGNFRCRIRVCGILINIGTYSHIENAARAYDTAAIKYFGEFAKLNFPLL